MTVCTATRLIDDERVRVTRFDFGPGEETGWHRHEHDYVITALTPCHMRLELPGGDVQEAHVKAGEAYRRTEGVEHNVINAGGSGDELCRGRVEVTLPHSVAAVFDAMPRPARMRLLRLRRIIFDAARASDVGEIEESLKWGQPAYRPKAPRVGTTIRLGWSESDPGQVTLYVHCQTRLLDMFRERFPTEFRYDGNRAVHLPVTGPLPEAAVHRIAAMALCYHRDKAAQLGAV